MRSNSGILTNANLPCWLGAAISVLAIAWMTGCSSSFEPLTVPQILEMTRAGVPPDTIITRIKDSNTVYRLHAHQIAQLSRDGVNPKVLDAMQQTYLNAVRQDQSLADWDNYALGDDGFFYGSAPIDWNAVWQ